MTISELSGFHRLSLLDRQARLAEICDLSPDDIRVLSGEAGLSADQANFMVENALGVLGVPLGLCANLRVNGQDRLVPMATEEPSVVAGASHAAKLIRAGGGVHTKVSWRSMAGQIQVLDVPDFDRAQAAVIEARDRIIDAANAVDPTLLSVGGGALDVEVRLLPPLQSYPDSVDDPLGPMMIVQLHVDVRDAMGANVINSMCERVAPMIEQATGGRVRLRIVSNLSDRRTVSATARVPFSALAGNQDLARGIEEASVFAERDPYRAATHNKGILNGVDAVLLAFGQDWRAVEAGAHAYAARGGRYAPLSRWRAGDGVLEGYLELPMAVGVVGGVVKVHPTVRVVRRLAGVTDAGDLASLAAAVGLAQNLGALRALAAEGIQTGHMRAHARNVAVAAGAVGEEVMQVASDLAEHRLFDAASARQALLRCRCGGNGSSEEGSASARSWRPPPDATDGPGASGSPTTVVDFQRLKRTFMPRIVALAEEVVRESSPAGSTLTEIFHYQMDTGGKRLRALLPMVVAETLQADPDPLIPFCAACETLHNATLVHDDLQDGDQLRRGRESIWQRFGEAQAINFGDAMFYYAVLLLGRLQVPPQRADLVRRRLLAETLRVLDGQQREVLLHSAERPGLAAYYTMVEAKTSGLFALPLAGAAELCGAKPQVVSRLEQAARHMGVLFQIQDDILDIYGDKGRQQQGSDIREGKRSVLVVHALEQAGADADRLRRFLDLERKLTGPQEIAEARAILDRSGALQFALDEIARRRELAIDGEADDAADGSLRRMVAEMCELFLAPIRGIVEGRR